MSDKLKKLTGKNPKDFEPAAYNLINECDIELFAELVQQEDFLFDFVKNNVSKRIQAVCNETNYKNLLHFLKYYSPSYEEVIISNLVKYADEDLTDIMLEKFENGTNDEKTYCAKYFEYIKDSLAKDFLYRNAFSDCEYLARNCAETLAVWKDTDSYNLALEKLKNEDDFEKLSAVKFLCAYGFKDAIPFIIEAMKNSVISENIAGEIPYLMNLFELMDNYYQDALIVINNIINGLGEILPLFVVFDFELYDVFENLLSKQNDSRVAVILLNSIEKFGTLTENDEYLFDEDKETKNEVKDIQNLINNANKNELKKLVNIELSDASPFVYTALEFAQDVIAIKELLKSNNQTVILKTAETLKKLGAFDETARTIALLKVTDINIRDIIRAL